MSPPTSSNKAKAASSAQNASSKSLSPIFLSEIVRVRSKRYLGLFAFLTCFITMVAIFGSFTHNLHRIDMVERPNYSHEYATGGPSSIYMSYRHAEVHRGPDSVIVFDDSGSLGSTIHSKADAFLTLNNFALIFVILTMIIMAYRYSVRHLRAHYPERVFSASLHPYLHRLELLFMCVASVFLIAATATWKTQVLDLTPASGSYYVYATDSNQNQYGAWVDNVSVDIQWFSYLVAACVLLSAGCAVKAFILVHFPKQSLANEFNVMEDAQKQAELEADNTSKIADDALPLPPPTSLAA